MWIITYICAPRTVNGNPRRGWFCELAGTSVTHWVEEGYEGQGALRRWLDLEDTRFHSSQHFLTMYVNVTVKEYKRFKDVAKECHR